MSHEKNSPAFKLVLCK